MREPTERDYLRRMERQAHFRSRGVPGSVQLALLVVIALLILGKCTNAFGG